MRYLMRRQGSEGPFSRPLCLSLVGVDQEWCVCSRDSWAAAAIDVQIDPRHIASARGVRDGSERGPAHSDLGPIQKGPGAARLPGDETGLSRKAGRTRDPVLG